MSQSATPKKKNKKQPAAAGGGGGGSIGSDGQILSNLDKSLFPSKPIRKERAPGIQVRLITNLFKISLKQDKPIYRYTIDIDALEEKDDKGDKGPAAKAVPRKIPKEIRQSAVKQAINEWIKNNDKNNKIRSSTFSYVLDTNASTMFALFDMSLTPTAKDQTKRKLEIKVTIKVPYCTKTGLVEENKQFTVKFQDGTPLNVRQLIDYCAGKGQQDGEKFKEHFRALNVILLGQIVTIPRFLVMQSVKSGISSVFPYERQSQFEISKGVLCNRGFTTSVRPTEGGVVLNVANTVGPFYEPSELTSLLTNRFRVRNLADKLSPDVVQSLVRELKTKQVEAMHKNYGTAARPHYRKYRIHDIGLLSTQEEIFDFNGQKVSVFDYFQLEYKYKLKYPKLPCVIDNGRKIPLEVCRLVDKQRVARKLNREETNQVKEEAVLMPYDHFQEVQKNAIEINKHSQPFVDFGLEIDMKPIEVTGRELPPIRLLGAKRAQIRTQRGGYDLRAGFVKPVVVNKWALMILVDDEVRRNYSNPNLLISEGQKFGSDYSRAGQQMGVQISSNNDVYNILLSNFPTEAQLKVKLREFFKELNNKANDLAIFVLPDRAPDWVYSYLQYLEADVKGARKPTEKYTRIACLKFTNYYRKILQNERNGSKLFLNNLWLKHNTKLGGVNIALDPQQTFEIEPTSLTKFLDPGYLFVSIDVCHPAPGDRLKQSVAAAVGMWALTNPGMSFCTRLRVQRKESEKDKSTVEEVGEIGVMFEEILLSYRKKTEGKMPTHVVILRDGVSEGQFKMVLQKELSQVKQVIANNYNKLKIKEPLLTCLTVQKRHKVRFMRKEPVKDFKGNFDYNIQPGTVVDSDITPPNAHSFYLAPHKAIQGTARAPYIYMIYDEIKFSQDSAQAMIHALSYLSPRCTKGTSIPTPVNLADLAAERGKNVVVSWNDDNSGVKMSDDERLAKLNAFLSNMGDESYRTALFYI